MTEKVTTILKVRINKKFVVGAAVGAVAVGALVASKQLKPAAEVVADAAKA